MSRLLSDEDIWFAYLKGYTEAISRGLNDEALAQRFGLYAVAEEENKKTLKAVGGWLEKRRQEKLKRRKEVLYEPRKSTLAAEIAELNYLIFTLQNGEFPE